MTTKYPDIKGLYKHYKGGLYEVITLAKHTTTDEVLVICKSVHFGSIHARPLVEWFEDVTDEDGKKCKRFEKITILTLKS